MTELKDPPKEASGDKSKTSKKRVITSEEIRVFGDNVYKERTSRRMKQSELQELSGVNIGSISETEKAKRNLSITTAERLANALDTNISALLTPEKDKHTRPGYAFFIRNFVKVRETNGISVAQVAAKTGLSRKTIHDIENGDNCTIDVAGRMANAIGVPLYKLFLP